MGWEQGDNLSRSVYRIDPDEQINTLVRVLRDATKPEVWFIAPEEGRVLRNPVNLRLLALYARQDGKTVTVITRDVVVQRLADEAGLLVAATFPGSDVEAGVGGQAARFKGQTARPAASRPVVASLRPQPWHLWLIPAFFGLLAFASYFGGPKVKLVIVPVRETRSTELELRLTGDAIADIRESVTVSASTEPTGRKRFGIAPARGTVTFISQLKEPVTVVAGTEVATTGGVSFRTESSVTVPGMTTEYFAKVAVGLRAGRAEAKARATRPGTESNVAAGRISVIKGPLAGRIQVVNPQATTGGEDRLQKLAAPADLARVRQLITAEAERLAQDKIREALPADTVLVPDSIEVKVGDPETATGPGEEVGAVTASSQVAVSALAYNKARLAGLAAARFDQALPGHLKRHGTIQVSVSRAERGDAATGTSVVVSAKVTGQVRGRVVVEDVVRAARGKSRAEALGSLERIPGVREVRLDPRVRRITSWRGRLDVVIADE